VNALVEIDGAVYMGARGGMSSSGITGGSVRAGDQLLHLLRQYAQDEMLLLNELQRQPNNFGIMIPQSPQFTLDVAALPEGYGFAIREMKSGATLWLGPSL
jgi:hypothetical protein